MTIRKLIDDERPILSAWGVDMQTGATVGQRSVSAIKPYEENGQMAAVTWLAVYVDDEVVARLNIGQMTEIRYAPE